MSVSDRLAQEDQILREIRLSLSTFRTMHEIAPSRRGAIYTSTPITSGIRLYRKARQHGFADTGEFRKAMPKEFRDEVFLPNLSDGSRFGEKLRQTGWRQVIVPGKFFAPGWSQEHYMSLWRQVIVRHARNVAFAGGWAWSLGCSEEFLIALQHEKRTFQHDGDVLPTEHALSLMRASMDEIDRMGFNVKPHYELWRQATLTVEANRKIAS